MRIFRNVFSCFVVVYTFLATNVAKVYSKIKLSSDVGYNTSCKFANSNIINCKSMPGLYREPNNFKFSSVLDTYLYIINEENILKYFQGLLLKIAVDHKGVSACSNDLYLEAHNFKVVEFRLQTYKKCIECSVMIKAD